MDQPSPDLFIDAAFEYLKTAAIQAAVAIDLFTAIAQEGGDLDRVAARTGASNWRECRFSHAALMNFALWRIIGSAWDTAERRWSIKTFRALSVPGEFHSPNQTRGMTFFHLFRRKRTIP